MILTWNNAFVRELTSNRMIVDSGGVSIVRNKPHFYKYITRSSRKRLDYILSKCDRVGSACYVAPEVLK